MKRSTETTDVASEDAIAHMVLNYDDEAKHKTDGRSST